MNQNPKLRFRPELEGLDGRALPTPLLMQACATGEHIPEAQVTLQEASAPSLSEIVVTKTTDAASTS
jgi:type VI protein secretion system component Hcp